MPDIYLISLSYQNSSTTTENSNSTGLANPNLLSQLQKAAAGASLEVRAGFFAVCVRGYTLTRTLEENQQWTCGKVESLNHFLTADSDPLNLVYYASKFSSNVVFYGLL